MAVGRSDAPLSQVESHLPRIDSIPAYGRRQGSTPMVKTADVEIRGSMGPRFAEVLTPAALEFLGRLHKEFEPRRQELLARRAEVQERLLAGEMPDFPAETKGVREGEWRGGPPPEELQKNFVEITRPTHRQKVINTLTSGADRYMAPL